MIEKTILKTAFCVFALMIYGFSSAASVGTMNQRRSFSSGTAKQPPPGFTFSRTGNGREGTWVIQRDGEDPDASLVLAQIDTDATSFRFPVAVAAEPILRDLRLSVMCKLVAGKVDQACGLVFRYRDENNYYVTRANALEDNVRFYRVSAGKRHELASWSGRVTSGIWHELRVDAVGDRFVVFWDDQKVIEARDSMFTEPGKIGLWTKADSVTYFDNLVVEAREGK